MDSNDDHVPSGVFRPPKQQSEYTVTTPQRVRYTAATPEADLIMRMKAGDNEAGNILFQRNVSVAYGFARRFARSNEDAEDIVTEAFARAFRNIHSFRGTSSFRTWLFRIISNLCRDHWGKAEAEASLRVPLTEVTENSAAAQSDPRDSDPATVLETNEFGQEVHAAIEALPENYRKAVLLYYIEGLSYDEIAGITGWTLTMVRNHLHRGRRRLAGMLSHYNESEGR